MSEDNEINAWRLGESRVIFENDDGTFGWAVDAPKDDEVGSFVGKAIIDEERSLLLLKSWLVRSPSEIEDWDKHRSEFFKMDKWDKTKYWCLISEYGALEDKDDWKTISLECSKEK